jgi:hypothetical protein
VSRNSDRSFAGMSGLGLDVFIDSLCSISISNSITITNYIVNIINFSFDPPVAKV